MGREEKFKELCKKAVILKERVKFKELWGERKN
jgi:hypothetical protein